MRELDERMLDIAGLFSGQDDLLALPDMLGADLIHSAPPAQQQRRAASCNVPQRSSTEEDDLILQARLCPAVHS